MFLDSMIDYKSEDQDIAMGNWKCFKSIIKTRKLFRIAIFMC